MEDQAQKLEYNKERFANMPLFNISNGKGILFAFTEGQELKTHTSPTDAWLVMLKGQSLYTINGEDHTLKAGSITAIPATVPHSLKAITNFKMILIR